MYKILGITDEVTTCDCCGRSNLKCTVGLETPDGATVYYGRDCAGRAVYGRKSPKNTDLVTSRARALQRCQNVLPTVLAAIAAGQTREQIKQTLGGKYSVHFGYYVDTGHKMPLRIYWDSCIDAGVVLPATAY